MRCTQGSNLWSCKGLVTLRLIDWIGLGVDLHTHMYCTGCTCIFCWAWPWAWDWVPLSRNCCAQCRCTLPLTATVYCSHNNTLVKNTESWKWSVYQPFVGIPTTVAALTSSAFPQIVPLVVAVAPYKNMASSNSTLIHLFQYMCFPLVLRPPFLLMYTGTKIKKFLNQNVWCWIH